MNSDPHPRIVFFVVGENEKQFAIPKDLLVSYSRYYRQYFTNIVDDIIPLPDTTQSTFGHLQHFLYTGSISRDHELNYSILIELWKMGHWMIVDGLCDAAIDLIEKCRCATKIMPTSLQYNQAWQDTPEASSIRRLLLPWVIEYVARGGDECVKSLSREVLDDMGDITARTDVGSQITLEQIIVGQTTVGQKQASCHAEVEGSVTKLDFCADLLRRIIESGEFPPRPSQDVLTIHMISDSLSKQQVGHFKQPVDLEKHPNYFEKITKPMDLGTIQKKFDSHEYVNHDELHADINLIFKNCYIYCEQMDEQTSSMRKGCDALQTYFLKQYQLMDVWMAKMRQVKEQGDTVSAESTHTPAEAEEIHVNDPSNSVLTSTAVRTPPKIPSRKRRAGTGLAEPDRKWPRGM